MKRILFALLGLALVLLPGLAEAYPDPVDGQRVYDLAGFMPDANRRDALNRELLAYEHDHNGAQVAVLTVPDTEGEAIEDYAHSVLRRWAIGQRSLNNGALLLMSRQADSRGHRTRIEVGYGLEGVLPDAVCVRIINETIIPISRGQQNPQGAIEAGARAILGRIGGQATQGPMGGPTGPATQASSHTSDNTVLFWVVVILLVIVLLAWWLSRGNRRGYSSSSSGSWLDDIDFDIGRGGGDGGSFGGGDDGGGGGSGGF